MKKFHKLRPSWWDAIVVVVVLVLASSIWYGMAQKQNKADQVEVVISQNGKELYRANLKSLTKEVEWILPDAIYPITVHMSATGVCVHESQCPGLDCKRQGTITQAGESIVCLPNQLLIRLVGTNAAMDAVIG